MKTRNNRTTSQADWRTERLLLLINPNAKMPLLHLIRHPSAKQRLSLFFVGGPHIGTTECTCIEELSELRLDLVGPEENSQKTHQSKKHINNNKNNNKRLYITPKKKPIVVLPGSQFINQPLPLRTHQVVGIR